MLLGDGGIGSSEEPRGQFACSFARVRDPGGTALRERSGGCSGV